MVRIIDFWMRFKAFGACEANQIEQYAVLTYRDPNDPQRDLHAYPQNNFPAYDSSYGDGSIINFPNTTCGNPSDNEFCISDLSSYVTDASVTVDPPQETFFLGFTNVGQSLSVIYKKNSYGNMYTSGDLVTVGAINNITFSFPTFPLLTQREMIGHTTFCDKNNLPESCTSQKICTCTHRLKISLNRYVEMQLLCTVTLSIFMEFHFMS
ncbi:CLUMA_CG010353, isoform A [Clunio marinus]|uniref:CLUMA_CG010353, isoform A n=1 Tax=Clunio marinus TaxID=568069 RepID=A0A1J1ID74_9DIPT|nr:CLUMA_CG010353, isoform A [Clunio marinus]